MNIGYLREFITLARYLNYSRAAKELFISQSTLSQHIMSVENELGFDLVDRRGKSTGLTPAGKAFLESSQRILADYDESVRRCADLASNRTPVVKIANFAFHYKFWNLLMERALRDERFKVQVVPYEQTSTYREEILRRGVNVFPYFSVDNRDEVVARLVDEGFACTYLGSDPFVVWMDETNPLAARETLEPQDLAGVGVLMSNAPCATHFDAAIAKQFAALGEKGPRLLYVDFDEASEYAFLDVTESVTIGTRTAFDNMVACYNSRAIARSVKGLDLHIDVYVLHRADDAAAASLLRAVCN